MRHEFALSIRQPWAWLILHAGKDIENRDWPTKFRGRIYVHASKGMTIDEYEEAADFAVSLKLGLGIKMPGPKAIERGGIVGAVDIVDCVSASDSPWFFGRYGFVLAKPRRLTFLPCKGQLGFFRPSPSAPHPPQEATDPDPAVTGKE
jgi:hypothetical protein